MVEVAARCVNPCELKLADALRAVVSLVSRIADALILARARSVASARIWAVGIDCKIGRAMREA